MWSNKNIRTRVRTYEDGLTCTGTSRLHGRGVISVRVYERTLAGDSRERQGFGHMVVFRTPGGGGISGAWVLKKGMTIGPEGVGVTRTLGTGRG